MKNILILMSFLSTPLHAAKAPWVGTDLSGAPCAGSAAGYGPYDYTKAGERGNIPIVEQYHFTPEVENHIKGKSGSVAADLDYTLRAVPNHHRALLSAIRYQANFKLGGSREPLLVPVECYLQRAINFSPEDISSYSLYAHHLKEAGHVDKAERIYQAALQISPDNARLAYAYAMFLIDQKRYDQALIYAQKAYTHGKPPPGLKNKLVQLGVWR